MLNNKFYNIRGVNKLYFNIKIFNLIEEKIFLKLKLIGNI